MTVCQGGLSPPISYRKPSLSVAVKQAAVEAFLMQVSAGQGGFVGGVAAAIRAGDAPPSAQSALSELLDAATARIPVWRRLEPTPDTAHTLQMTRVTLPGFPGD